MALVFGILEVFGRLCKHIFLTNDAVVHRRDINAIILTKTLLAEVAAQLARVLVVVVLLLRALVVGPSRVIHRAAVFG